MISVVGAARGTGRLGVCSSQGEKALWFAEGLIVSADSTDPDDGLLQLCLREGAISWADLRGLGAKATSDAPSDLILESRLVEPDRMAALLRLHVLEIAASLASWPRGSYHYVEKPGPRPWAPEAAWAASRSVSGGPAGSGSTPAVSISRHFTPSRSSSAVR